MAVSTIDGTLESVTVKRKASRLWRLHDIVIRRPDGGEARIEGMCVVTPEIGAALQPGVTGRFYFYKSIDNKGIHAIRASDGSLLMKFPGSNEKLMAILFVINVVAAAAVYAVDARPNWLMLGLIPFTGILYLVYRSARREAEAQVAHDNS